MSDDTTKTTQQEQQTGASEYRYVSAIGRGSVTLQRKGTNRSRGVFETRSDADIELEEEWYNERNSPSSFISAIGDDHHRHDRRRRGHDDDGIEVDDVVDVDNHNVDDNTTNDKHDDDKDDDTSIHRGNNDEDEDEAITNKKTKMKKTETNTTKGSSSSSRSSSSSSGSPSPNSHHAHRVVRFTDDTKPPKDDDLNGRTKQRLVQEQNSQHRRQKSHGSRISSRINNSSNIGNNSSSNIGNKLPQKIGRANLARDVPLFLGLLGFLLLVSYWTHDIGNPTPQSKSLQETKEALMKRTAERRRRFDEEMIRRRDLGCSLYLAESRIPGAGLSLFVGRDHDRGSRPFLSSSEDPTRNPYAKTYPILIKPERSMTSSTRTTTGTTTKTSTSTHNDATTTHSHDHDHHDDHRHHEDDSGFLFLQVPDYLLLLKHHPSLMNTHGTNGTTFANVSAGDELYIPFHDHPHGEQQKRQRGRRKQLQAQRQQTTRHHDQTSSTIPTDMISFSSLSSSSSSLSSSSSVWELPSSDEYQLAHEIAKDAIHVQLTLRGRRRGMEGTGGGTSALKLLLRSVERLNPLVAQLLPSSTKELQEYKDRMDNSGRNNNDNKDDDDPRTETTTVASLMPLRDVKPPMSSLEWLEYHGHCLDHVRLERAADGGGGGGGGGTRNIIDDNHKKEEEELEEELDAAVVAVVVVATRPIRSGEIIVVAPLYVLHRETFHIISTTTTTNTTNTTKTTTTTTPPRSPSRLRQVAEVEGEAVEETMDSGMASRTTTATMTTNGTCAVLHKGDEDEASSNESTPPPPPPTTTTTTTTKTARHKQPREHEDEDDRDGSAPPPSISSSSSSAPSPLMCFGHERSELRLCPLLSASHVVDAAVRSFFLSSSTSASTTDDDDDEDEDEDDFNNNDKRPSAAEEEEDEPPPKQKPNAKLRWSPWNRNNLGGRSSSPDRVLRTRVYVKSLSMDIIATAPIETGETIRLDLPIHHHGQQLPPPISSSTWRMKEENRMLLPSLEFIPLPDQLFPRDWIIPDLPPRDASSSFSSSSSASSSS